MNPRRLEFVARPTVKVARLILIDATAPLAIKVLAGVWLDVVAGPRPITSRFDYRGVASGARARCAPEINAPDRKVQMIEGRDPARNGRARGEIGWRRLTV